MHKNKLDKTVIAPVPESSLEISNDKKIDILLSIHNSVRADALVWKDKSYNATIWSTGILFGIVALFVQNFDKIQNIRFVLLIGSALLILLTQK